MKKLVQLVIMVVSLLVMSVTALAADSLVDNARILNSKERTTVERALQDVESKYGVRVAVVTIRQNSVNDLGKYAKQVLDSNYKNGKNGNQLLVINMASNKWNIVRDTKMAKMISKDYGAKVLDQKVVEKLKERKFMDAFTVYAGTTGQQLEYYKKNNKAMSAPTTTAKSSAKTTATAAKGSQNKGHNWPVAIGGALVVGVLAAFIYGGSLKRSMSNVAFEEQADQYMKAGSFRLTESSDTFMYFTYARIPKPKQEENSSSEEADSSELEEVSDASEDASDSDHDDEGGSF